MIRWLRRLFPCAHRATYRESRGGVLHLVCPRCDHAVPAVTWTKAEKAKRQRLQQRLQKPAAVVDIRKRSA